MPSHFRQSFICPFLIGRDDQLARLRDVLDRAMAGTGGTILVVGEAGIGKSRLAAEGRKYADARGMLVLSGHCYERDRTLPYAPFLDLLRVIIAAELAESLRDCLAPIAQGLGPLAPELASLFPERASAPAPGAEQVKRHIFHGVTQTVLRLADRGPVFLTIEDIHWCDAISLELLLHLARMVPARPILLALTYRADEMESALRHFLADLERERLAMELALPPLDRAGVAAMARATLGLDHPAPVDAVEALSTLTDGNPFFIEECLKSLAVAADRSGSEITWDVLATNDLHMPQTVQDAVWRRSGQLSVAARRTLLMAAVVGQRFDFALLQALTGQNEADLLSQIKELVAAQLVVEVSTEQFAFRHALTRHAIYTGLLARERTALHREIAETIERLYSDTLDPHLADLAYHCSEAQLWAGALEYARRAGERAQTLQSPLAAVAQFSRAIAAAPHVADTSTPPLHLARGHAFETLGDFERARADYERALSVAQDEGDRPQVWQAMIDLGLLWEGRDYERAGGWFRRAIEYATALGDPVLHARSLNPFGNWLVNIGEPAEGLAAHRAALATFEQRKDARGIAETRDLVGMANWFYGDIVESVHDFSHAVAASRSLGDTRGLISALTSRANVGSPGTIEPVVSALRSYDECMADVEEALRLARQAEWRGGEVYAGFVACVIGTAFGEWRDIFRRGNEALRIAEEIEHQQWIAAARCMLGQAFVTILAPDQAVAHLETALASAEAVGSAWWAGYAATYLACAYLSLGDVPRAEAAVTRRLPPGHPPRNLAERRLRWVRGECLLARGAPADALAVAEQLLASLPGTPQSQPVTVLQYLRGRALLALRHNELAREALEDAKRGALLRGERPLLWQIHGTLASVSRRARDEEGAGQEAAAAHAVIETLAATLDDPALRDTFLVAARAQLPPGRMATPHRPSGDQFGGLTAREWAVVEQIARGLSNREIADALFIAQKTVEAHVTNSLNKLGFRSRTQLAAWASRRIGERSVPSPDTDTTP